jgi:hypothetical protein
VFKPPIDALDREFKEHLVFVFNQVLQNLRKTGLTAQTLETVGKLLFRLYNVFQAYKSKKTKYTLSEWVEKLVTLGKEFNNAFATGNN